MFRGIVTKSARVVKSSPVRSFFTIPSREEMTAGRNRDELNATTAGQVGFNRDPIIPPEDAGTRENPILVSGLCGVFCLFFPCALCPERGER